MIRFDHVLRSGYTAYQNYIAQAEIEEHRLEALRSSREALSVAQAQYSVGTVDYINLLDAQRSLIDAETQYIKSRQARLESAISLYRALGGGFAEKQ